MKIAVVLLPKTKEPPLVLLDSKDKAARMFFITQGQQFAFLVALLLSAAVIAFIAFEPASLKKAVAAVSVPRAQQVMLLERDSALEVGDSVFVPAIFAPSICKIAGLPRQSVEFRDAGGAGRFLILGQDRYYVTAPDGLGQIVRRADLRRLVSN